MYAPYGGGVLVGPRSTFETGDPFLAGGGAVDLVDLDEVVWTDPPEREEAGSPNVIGAVALHAAIDELTRIGWPAIVAHDDALARRLRDGLAAIDGVRLLGPAGRTSPTLPVATFVVDGVHHALVAARLERGARHRRPPRVLLRPPLPAPPARPRRGRGGRRTGRPSSGATAATSRGRCGPAPGCRPPRPTSTASWPRSPTSPAAATLPSPTTRIPDTGDYWPRTDRRRPGRPPPAVRARRAPAADRRRA